ncbi:MAG: RNA methyltransferase [Parachlamydiaceae bacterium]|nr:RNA methyltransferase [Parachlamydiaceae bacterium]
MSLEINISSIKDQKIIEARLLQTGKGRFAEGKLLLEGKEQIVWALQNSCHIDHVFVHEKERNSDFLNLLRSKKLLVCFCSDGILKKITDTSYLVPFVGVAKSKPYKNDLKQDFVIVLDGLHDFGNIGTVVRTAAAFGIHDFISTDENLDFSTKKTIDSSRGTVFSSNLQRFKSGTEAVNHLKRNGYQIAVTTPHASTIQSFAQLEQKPIALVFGNETLGVSEEVMSLADLKIQIPMSGPVESLNVGVAAGISLYEMKIKWTLAMLTKKIQESIGRDLFCASRWMRLVFHSKLKEVSPFNADQAVMMMILKCDQSSAVDSLTRDAGIPQGVDANVLIQPLIDQGFISNKGNQLTLSEKGEEAIAKIWNVHELTEYVAFEGVSDPDKKTFLNVISKILNNCEKIIPYS